MKRKILISVVFVLLTAMCFAFVGCSKSNDEPKADGSQSHASTQTDKQLTSAITTASTTENIPAEYTYQVSGMQNANISRTVKVTPGENYICEGVEVFCPVCGYKFYNKRATLPAENIGDDSYIYTNTICCMEQHPNVGDNGFFEYTVMFAKAG